MAADSDGGGGGDEGGSGRGGGEEINSSCSSCLTTVVTCEGDLGDPDFPARFNQILDELRELVCDDRRTRSRLHVRKLEPWNSVRVTLAIPREAALRLRQLANEGSQQLRALGILSVQVEGDQVISLRLAGRYGQEPQEIVLRSTGGSSTSTSSSSSGSGGGGTTAGGGGGSGGPSTSASAMGAAVVGSDTAADGILPIPGLVESTAGVSSVMPGLSRVLLAATPGPSQAPMASAHLLHQQHHTQLQQHQQQQLVLPSTSATSSSSGSSHTSTSNTTTATSNNNVIVTTDTSNVGVGVVGAVDKVQFRSPNVICPTDTQVPKVPPLPVQTVTGLPVHTAHQRNYNGPFPFASMTHAAQAIHSRESQAAAAAAVVVAAAGAQHPYTGLAPTTSSSSSSSVVVAAATQQQQVPPPPYPTTAIGKVSLNPGSPNVAMSSPLLVNLLQNDGNNGPQQQQQQQATTATQKMLPPQQQQQQQVVGKVAVKSRTIGDVDGNNRLLEEPPELQPPPPPSSAAVGVMASQTVDSNQQQQQQQQPPQQSQQSNTNSAFVPLVPTTIKYPAVTVQQQMVFNNSNNNSTVPNNSNNNNLLASNISNNNNVVVTTNTLVQANNNINNNSGVRVQGPRQQQQQQQLLSKMVNTQQQQQQQVPAVRATTTLVQQQQTVTTVRGGAVTVTRQPPPLSVGGRPPLPFGTQFPRQGFRGQLAPQQQQQQVGVAQQYGQQYQQQAFPSPPPYPRQRLDAVIRTSYQDITRYHQQQNRLQQQPPTSWQQQAVGQFHPLDSNAMVQAVVGQPMPSLSGLGHLQQQQQQPIAQPMPHLGSLLDSSLSAITPSLTDLSKTDLDSLLPSLEGELLAENSTPDLPDLMPPLLPPPLSAQQQQLPPEALTSSGKRRQYLINPLTGVLEPMPTDSSGSDSEPEPSSKEAGATDVFNDFNSPLNDRSNSIYSDDDTCSTTISMSKRFDTTDQSDSEATVKSTTSETSVKSHQRIKSSGKARERNRGGGGGGGGGSADGKNNSSKDSQPEKIKLRLKLEKSEPVSAAYSVDVSFVNAQQPKRATQNVSGVSVSGRTGGSNSAAGTGSSVLASTGILASSTGTTIPGTILAAGTMSASGGSNTTSNSSSGGLVVTGAAVTSGGAAEELRVPPLHISLRGRNHVVINSEKKKKYPKLNADGTATEFRRSKKTTDGAKVKKSMSAKELSVRGTATLISTAAAAGALSKSDSSLTKKHSDQALVDPKHHLSADEMKSLKAAMKSPSSDVDDLPLNCRMREPGEIVSTKSKQQQQQQQPAPPPMLSDMVKKSKKSSNKFNHIADVYREQNLLTGGHLVDDYKSLRKSQKGDDKGATVAKKSTTGSTSSSSSAAVNSTHLKKDKFRLGKDRDAPGHVGEMRRGSDSDVVKGLKRHADTNGLSHAEKKRRLSQSEGKMNNTTVTESQGGNKSVKLKSSSAGGGVDSHNSTSTSSLSIHQTVVGSTNVGTIGKALLKSSSTAMGTSTNNTSTTNSSSTTGSKIQRLTTKGKRDKVTPFVKMKESGSFKSKDLNRDKTYAQNVAEKLAKQLPLPIGEIDMEAKFKQGLLESSATSERRHHTTTSGSSSSSSSSNSNSNSKVTDTNSNSGTITEQLVQSILATDKPCGLEPMVADTRQQLQQQQQHMSSVNAQAQQAGCQTLPELSTNPSTTAAAVTSSQTQQRLDDKQSGRSPNSGGQGEDSGIESMDALSEKSPNQASQSPHSHTDIGSLVDVAGSGKTSSSNSSDAKLDGCRMPDLMDIEEQLAKMDGLATLNGDLSHMCKTEPFMKTETLIEKLEGTERERKDLNENKEHHGVLVVTSQDTTLLDECSSVVERKHVDSVKVQNTTSNTTPSSAVSITTTTASSTTLTTMAELKNECTVSLKELTTFNNTTITTAAATTVVMTLGTNIIDTTKAVDIKRDDLTITPVVVVVEPKAKLTGDLVKKEPPPPPSSSSLLPTGAGKTDAKDLDFDPLPIRRKPPLYTYSNPEKQTRDSDSPIPNLSDLEYDNSDSNSECSELKSKISQKAATVTRRRKQNLDNIQLNDAEMDACIEAHHHHHYLTDLAGFKKNDIAKKTPKSLLEQLLIEIPSEISDKAVSSTSPSVSSNSKSSIRTRSSSKLNSPDISECSKSEKSLKTPRHSPVILKQDSPANSPVLCVKASPKTTTPMTVAGTAKGGLGGGGGGGSSSAAVVPGKRKRQESESSTQSNVSVDEGAANSVRTKKARKCSENAAELIKACMGVTSEGADNSNSVNNTTTTVTGGTTTTVVVTATTTAAVVVVGSAHNNNNNNNNTKSTASTAAASVANAASKTASGTLQKDGNGRKTSTDGKSTSSTGSTKVTVNSASGTTGLLRKSQLVDAESSDSDEPLIEIAGKVRNKHVATRNKHNSTKSGIPTPIKTVPGTVPGTTGPAGGGGGGGKVTSASGAGSTEEKAAICTRRSVRNNAAASGTLKTRSKHLDKGSAAVIGGGGSTGGGSSATGPGVAGGQAGPGSGTTVPGGNSTSVTDTDANTRRKTRSAVSDDGNKRRRNSRDGK